KELSAEQAFWLKHSSLSETPVKSHTPVRIEAPSELPKGFEHTKECFVTEIIPFLKDIFNAFDKTILDEITEVQTVFNQMEATVDQYIVHIVANYVDILDVKKSCVNDCSKCLELETELLKKKDFVEKEAYDKLVKDSVENLKKDIDEIETINIELEHSVAKLLSENENLRKEREHLKSIYKDQFDSIRKTRVQSKEHCDSLIAQINAKSVESSYLNGQLQEKVFAITTLKNELRKLKGKNVVNTAISKSIATIALGMFKPDIEPISLRLKNNRDAHKELLVYASQTCPNSPKPNEKLVDVTPMNKDKRLRFADLITSSSNVPKQTNSFKSQNSNKHVLHSTRINYFTSASGSKPSGNTKNNRISQSSSSNKINNVKDQSRSVKSRKNKMNYVDKSECNANVMQSVSKAKSIKNKQRKEWKPTGKVFTKIGFSWKPTRRIFTIVGNRCPLTRITSKLVSPKETIIALVITPALKVFGALCYPTNDGEDLGPRPKLLTPGIISSGLYLNPSPSVDYQVPAPKPAVSTGTPSSTTIDQDAPSTKSSTQVVIPNHVHAINQPPEHINKWTKDHPIDNSYKDALAESCWIEAMQKELNEFERLEV
ncbi:hypothetical protein Tco_1297920, partial [Tanacetum coccineum]